jgi:LysM repeat protein
MKRISLFLALALLGSPAMLRAQDAATEERLNKLTAQIEVLVEIKDAQNKRIDELTKAIEALQRQMDKPSPNYASAEDVKRLADAIKEVDRKRQDDNDKILTSIREDLKKLSKLPPVKPAPTTSSANDNPIPDKGYKYVIQSGDTLSVIASAYRDKNIKVTPDQILKANPGLKAEKLRVGQEIFIPAPQ